MTAILHVISQSLEDFATVAQSDNQDTVTSLYNHTLITKERCRFLFNVANSADKEAAFNDALRLSIMNRADRLSRCSV